ncbi:MAG: DUF362 domain-containing protein [Syntrophobacteraceae bacterium]
MNGDDQVYAALAEHLDRLPMGFPKTPTGVELRILKKLFTPEDAAMTMLLSFKPESPHEVAERCWRTPEEMAQILEDLAQKGHIFRVRRGDQVFYMAAQFIVGIWEFHLNDLDPDLIRDMNEYFPYFWAPTNDRTQQLRTIPTPKSISPQQAIMPYEEARKLLAEQEKIAVTNCICKTEHVLVGKGCGRPTENCLSFGDIAQYYVDNGLGRLIDVDEAVKILESAEQNAMVLQSSNAVNIANLCSCCGCCCQVLINLKSLPEPSKYAVSNYFATVNREQCSGCEICVHRCQMDAVVMDDGKASILKERCIGCGLCVTTCPEEAVIFHTKPENERSSTPPSDFFDMYAQIGKERRPAELKK